MHGNISERQRHLILATSRGSVRFKKICRAKSDHRGAAICADLDTAGSTSNWGFVPQNSSDIANEKASGDFDLRHRFTLSLTYQLPSRKHSWAQLLEGWQVTSLATVETGPPVITFDNFNDFAGTGEGPGNGNNDRWNIQGNPNNLKTSANAAIPFLDASDPVCQSVATTPGLQLALETAGGCFSQNGTILYPNVSAGSCAMARTLSQLTPSRAPAQIQKA